MIPDAITAAHIRAAIKELSRDGWPPKFSSRNWDLVSGLTRVPPKQAVRVAAHHAGVRIGRCWGRDAKA